MSIPTAVTPVTTPRAATALAPAVAPPGFAPLPAAFAPNALQTGVIHDVAAQAAAGRADMATFLAAHPGATDETVLGFADGIKLPPDAAGQTAELAFLHKVQATRTPAENITARFYSDYGRRDIWQRIVDQWATTVPAADAANGQALLTRAVTLNAQANATLKDRFARPHPYRIDPTLDPITGTGGTENLGGQKAGKKPSYSYPSSHTSDAFVGAAVAAHLMPGRAAEFTQLAEQVAYSRVYAGVHYLSDVTAAAWLGSAIAGYVMATPAAQS